MQVFEIHISNIYLYFVFEIHFENVICICIRKIDVDVFVFCFSSKKCKTHFDVEYISKWAIGHFLLVVLWNQACVSNGFRDIQWRM